MNELDPSVPLVKPISPSPLAQGMIWVGLGMIPNNEGLNRLSFYFGAGGQAMQEPPEEAPNETDKKTGEALGRRVAEVTKKLSAAGAA